MRMVVASRTNSRKMSNLFAEDYYLALFSIICGYYDPASNKLTNDQRSFHF
jgi:hypothetical protein